jgi:hypothetical protein
MPLKMLVPTIFPTTQLIGKLGTKTELETGFGLKVQLQ